MPTTKKDPVLVVLQLTGGNDYFHTVIPYTDPLYWKNRPYTAIPEDQIVRLDGELGLNPNMAPMKKLYDDGKMAIIHGIGYQNSPRSHFRSMDIWHTCEPDKVGTEGWLGRTLRDLDPKKENVVTGVNFGPSLPRAMALPGVPVACVTNLDTYGLLPGISGEAQRREVLERFARMYSPAIGKGAVMDYLAQTGLDSLKGADILKVAPERYRSTVKYPATRIARNLKGIAQIHFADLGTRIFCTDHGSFDTHACQALVHAQLWREASEAITAFFADLREHDAADNVLMYLFSEFGRRVRDNGSGTDHGAAGVAFAIGEKVNGGMYNEYPSRKPEDLQQGDLVPNYDFRGAYATILDKWMGMEPTHIVGGKFEQLAFV